MAKLNTILTSSDNQRLFDMLFRHQAYLEGVKTSFAGEYTKTLNELYDAFAKYFAKMRYTSMDQFTKRELKDFIRLFQQEQTHFYSIYTERLIKLLQQFLAADVEVTHAIYKDITGKTPKQLKNSDLQQLDNPTPLFGALAASGTEAGNHKLWAYIANDPIPATGHLLYQAISGFVSTAMFAVASTLNKGYANAWTGQETLYYIAGATGSLFAKLDNQNKALIATILQHVSAGTQAAVGSSYTSKYQWASIMDSRTTEICWNRNGTIYVFGEGPLPPAHYNCRSRALPLLPGNTGYDIPTSYLSWLKNQSDLFQNNLLGEAKAKLLRNGNFDSKLIGTIEPITIPQFVSKIPYILGE